MICVLNFVEQSMKLFTGTYKTDCFLFQSTQRQGCFCSLFCLSLEMCSVLPGLWADPKSNRGSAMPTVPDQNLFRCIRLWTLPSTHLLQDPRPKGCVPWHGDLRCHLWRVSARVRTASLSLWRPTCLLVNPPTGRSSCRPDIQRDLLQHVPHKLLFVLN